MQRPTRPVWWLAGVVVLGLAQFAAGCEPPAEPGAAATAVRAAALARATRPPPGGVPGVPAGPVPSPTPVPTPRPGPTATPLVYPTDDDLARSDAEARQPLERALSSPALPGIEDLLLDTVALAAPDGGQMVPRAAAARWLRERAQRGVRLIQFERHHHLPLIVTSSVGWLAKPPLARGRLGLNFHRYAASGVQDPEHGAWKIDTITVE
jgi:hypothetical protein